jgi:hypothetical protein
MWPLMLLPLLATHRLKEVTYHLEGPFTVNLIHSRFNKIQEPPLSTRTQETHTIISECLREIYLRTSWTRILPITVKDCR